MPHTPGPWTVDGEDCFAKVLAPDGYVIAETQHVHGGSTLGDSEEIHLANMRLIAAAPDLLAELKGAVEALMYVELQFPAAHGYGVRKERIRSGLAAIAKAGTA